MHRLRSGPSASRENVSKIKITAEHLKAGEEQPAFATGLTPAVVVSAAKDLEP